MKDIKSRLLLICALLVLFSAPVTLSDWDPGDGHKMHYPQLPKPGGWDVSFSPAVRLADDWQCSESGPVEDIHFWVSWKYDDVQPINGFSVRIWSDEPCGPGGYSEPNELRWEREFYAGDFTVRDMPPDLQSWFNPFDGTFNPNDHTIWQQINIVDVCDPFPQEEGEIYWLEIDMWGAIDCGWKESVSPHFRDDAVGWWSSQWNELRDPITEETMDLAFVITGGESGIKWQQLPDADETGFHAHDGLYISDDWLCEGGLVTDLHWWGNNEDDAYNNVGFEISIFADAGGIPDVISGPLWMVFAPLGPGPGEVRRTDSGLVTPWFSPVWFYEYDLPVPFPQVTGQVYWLSLSAISEDPMMSPMWHWQGNADPIILADPVQWDFGGYMEPLGMNMAFVITSEVEEPETGIKWVQYPDLADTGIDVDITWCGPAGDDFLCTTSGPILDVHIWGSWLWDELPLWWEEPLFGDPTAMDFIVQIWSDNPMGPMGYSEPNELLWERWFMQGDFDVSLYAQDLYEGYYGPCEGYYEPYGDSMCWKYDFYIDPCEAFIQEGTMDGPVTYWLVVQALPYGIELGQVYFGWKTSLDHWNDDAVWGGLEPPDVLSNPNPQLLWNELRYPIGHPFEGQSIDLAFVITSEEEEPESGIKWEQLPDLNDTGVDVDITICGPAADDFLCTTSGPILDIHIWGSWFNDYLPLGDPTEVDFFIEIWSDNPMGPSGHSEPNEFLWWEDFPKGTFTASLYAEDLEEGYYIPCDMYEPQGDTKCYKYDFYIDPCEAFIQEGTPEEPVVYWLLVGAMPHDEAYFGWKTSLDHWNDDAVWPGFMDWEELRYPMGYGHPFEGQSMDLAFMITGEGEEEKKQLIEHSKWSQPPIEIDPTSSVPEYCGWDEMSFREWVEPIWYDAWNCLTQCYGDADCDGYVGPQDLIIFTQAFQSGIYDPRADFDRDGDNDLTDLAILQTNWETYPPANCWLGESWMMVADDFRCLGTMPITSVHWWGSYWDWIYPGTMPDILPIGWKICFWSNVPADPTGEPDFSYPEELLWQIEVDADRVDIEEVGTDSYHGYFPNDVCYQYTLQLEPEEWFWQYDFNDLTEDSVFWLSIAAIYDPCEEFIENPWGWKTRPWHWMDDAVRFWIEGPLEPGLVFDPCNYYIEPIEDPIYYESVDVAFELDTDPNYIKWEQHYTGIRDWPHYEDVPSWAEMWEWGPQSLVAAADDWPCDNNRPITAMAWWGSYLGYEYMPCHGPTTRPEPPAYFWISIWTDVPSGADPDPAIMWSHPDEMIWEHNAYDYDEVLVGYDKHPFGAPPGVPREPVFRYSVRLPEEEWFWQEEDEAVYWLMIVAVYEYHYPEYEWGWTLHQHVYNDDAVKGQPIIDDGEDWEWYEVQDQTGASADMSFILYTDPNAEPPEEDLDFGDANDPPYPTLLANDGARHIIDGPWLGPADDAPDPEGDGQPDPQALGDDNDGNDDEDGVTIPLLNQVVPATITVEVFDPAGVGGIVEIWIDFDGNGSWEASEIVFGAMLPTGVHLIPVTAPFGSVVGQTFARCRISSQGTGSPTGLADDGEVEDHEVIIAQGPDFGDANDPSYPTLLANNGARHIIDGPWLGPADDSPDPEGDGQPDPQALGDDNDGNDDEDGVTIPTLIRGIPTNITVEVFDPAGVGGFVEIWIDFDGSGSWEAAELVFGAMLPTGQHLIQVTAPFGSVVGQTFARCRISSHGTGSPTGLAPDGEVEDYEVNIQEGRDFGDANHPPYPTLGPGAARHIILPGVMLGASIDAELDGQPDATATGDDNDGNDDEDGVVFTSLLIPGQQATVDVTASVPGMLNAWIDYYSNGDWADAVDQVFNNVALTGGGMTDTLTFTVSASAKGNRDTFARFRFNTAGGLTYTGHADDGEVEDYLVHIDRVKWFQPPEEMEPGLYYGWDELSIFGGTQIVADDWPCETEEAVTDIHWWGSYVEWDGPEPPPPPSTPIGFHIGIWTDVPAGIDTPWSHPSMMVWEYHAGIAEVNEQFVGFDTHPEHFPDSCFKYELQLPEEYWFYQEDDPCGTTIYWLSIAAFYADPPATWPWGWKTRPHFFNDDAVRIFEPNTPVPGVPYEFGEPIENQEGSWDMAFILFMEGYPKCWSYLTQCHGDSDNSGDVKVPDFKALKDSWYKVYPHLDYDPCADFDRNGDVKVPDFKTLKDNWYQVVPPNCPPGGTWPP